MVIDAKFITDQTNNEQSQRLQSIADILHEKSAKRKIGWNEFMVEVGYEALALVGYGNGERNEKFSFIYTSFSFLIFSDL